MTVELTQAHQAGIKEATKQLAKAVASKKCWGCGCFHNSLSDIEKTLPIGQLSKELDSIIRSGRERFLPITHACLGCKICYPALAVNAIDQSYGECSSHLDVCPDHQVEERQGWPPFPGAYTVLKYQAPVAICTLTNNTLADSIAHERSTGIAIIGTLQTENLGIERLISNILANPNIRFLVICGEDSRQTVGHLPGQSLLALAHSGIDSNGHIIRAHGKRPFLRNLRQEAIDHFRRTVEVIDLIGNTQVTMIIDVAKDCSKHNPRATAPFIAKESIKRLVGYLPKRVIPDRAGYFVIYVNRTRQLLSLEHYQNDGLLDAVIEGKTAAELYTPAIEKNMVSRLDHAAYLGRELAGAEQSLLSGHPYVQDAAPELKKSVNRDSGCFCLQGVKS